MEGREGRGMGMARAREVIGVDAGRDKRGDWGVGGSGDRPVTCVFALGELGVDNSGA